MSPGHELWRDQRPDGAIQSEPSDRRVALELHVSLDKRDIVLVRMFVLASQ